MNQYLKLVEKVLNEGTKKEDRTGTGTISYFGAQMRFDLSEGFPLVTTKKLHFKSIKAELLWLLKGTGNIQFLRDNNVSIWDEWADENGNLGPVYGVQWRKWKQYKVLDKKQAQSRDDLEEVAGLLFTEKAVYLKEIDQMCEVINSIKNNPNSRRHIVSAWNPADISEMALPPCHTLFQFDVTDGKLNCHLFQRSADLFLGVPYNIASYALLTSLVAHVTGLKPGTFLHSITDCHIYLNHINQMKLQLQREPRKLPQLLLNSSVKEIDDFKMSDITLENYDAHPHIKGDVSV